MDNEKLDKILEKVEENNIILKKMRRASFWGNVFRVCYWGIIITLSIGAYWFIQPYFNSLMETYSGIQSDINNVKNVTSKIPSSIGDLLR
ncbi:MAG: hypothetical protein WCC74_03615 [Minisyncoccia bacterium]